MLKLYQKRTFNSTYFLLKIKNKNPRNPGFFLKSLNNFANYIKPARKQRKGSTMKYVELNVRF
jgi:hypothetical protein